MAQEEENKAKRRRPADYNSNRARDELRKELAVLRGQVQELERVLSALQAAKLDATRRKCKKIVGRDRENAVSEREARVWKELIVRQIEQRTTAEGEQKELKRMIKSQEKIIAELQHLVYCKATGKALTVVSRASTIPQSLVQATLDFDVGVFHTMLDQVDERYRIIDQVFQSDSEVGQGSHKRPRRGKMRKDAEGHLYFQIFGRKVFPFGVDKVGDAAWERFSYSVRPNDSNIFSQYYDAPEDSIAELFATELQIDDKKAVVFPTQVKRLYRDEGRVAIVWQSTVNTVEFTGRQLSGAAYQEKGYFLIEKPPLAPDGFAVLRTCYIITPSVPTRSLPRDSMTFELMEFVFKWMAATIPANHQILEDMLVLESIGASSSPEPEAVAHSQAHRCLRAARRHVSPASSPV